LKRLGLEFNLFGNSLSSRVLWLTVGIIMLVEMVILIPSLGHERVAWLSERLTQAQLAAFSIGAAPNDYDHNAPDIAARLALLKRSGVESVSLLAPGAATRTINVDGPVTPDRRIDLRREPITLSMAYACQEALGFGGTHLEFTAPSQLQNSMMVRVIISAAALRRHLQTYAWHIAGLSLIIALVTGLLVFAALDRLLVRPMRIMTASIAGFRQDPEHALQSDLSWLGNRRHDEISIAARELAAMQDELRTALWRNARLAALGTAVAKISHDLRNILTSALLVADRLQETADPVAKRAANTLIPAVERAAELVSQTVDFAREGPPALIRAPVGLRALVDEVAIAVSPEQTSLEIDNQVPRSLVLALDRAQIYRVLINLLRNAAEAGASRVVLSTEGENGHTELLVADNGPGLPERVQQNLFRPFTGSFRRGGTGLGLAIARDLTRAHGGDLVLRYTGPHGTAFAMALSVVDVAGT
jgi:signal transduction histidine kinase